MNPALLGKFLFFSLCHLHMACPVAAEHLEMWKETHENQLNYWNFIHSVGHRGVQKAIESIIILMED